MEFLLEILLELILEGSIEISQNKKVPLIIRIPLIIIISSFFLLVIGLIIFTGAIILETNKLAGIFFIALGIIMFLLCIKKLKDLYLKKDK